MVIKRIFFALALLLLLLGGLIFVHLSTSGLEYSRYNPSWNGTSAFFLAVEDRGGVEIHSPAKLDSYSDALLLIIQPSGNFTPEEASIIRPFSNGEILW
jgi:energy-converting hydrogenase Eha subunit F